LNKIDFVTDLLDLAVLVMGFLAILVPALLIFNRMDRTKPRHSFLKGLGGFFLAPLIIWRETPQKFTRLFMLLFMLGYVLLFIWHIVVKHDGLLYSLAWMLFVYLILWLLIGGLRLSLNFISTLPLKPLLIYSLFMPPLAIILFEALHTPAAGMVLVLTLMVAHALVLIALLLCVVDIRNFISSDTRYHRINMIFGILLLLFNLLMILCAESVSIAWLSPGLGKAIPYINHLNLPVTDWRDLVYYTLVTFATVGYGDIIPNTYWAKFQACSIILSSIFFLSIFVAAIGMDASRMISAIALERESEEEKPEPVTLVSMDTLD